MTQELCQPAIQHCDQPAVGATNLGVPSLDRDPRVEAEILKYGEMLQTIMDHIPVMLVSFCGDGKVQFVNRELHRAIKWNLDESCQFNPIHALYPDPEGRKCIEEFLIRTDGQWEDFPTRLRETDARDIRWMSRRMTDGSYLAIGQDITTWKRIERGLQESERFAKATVNALGAHIAILDENGRIMSVNTAWKRFADENGLKIPEYGVGASYLQVCDMAAATTPSGEFVAMGLRAVLSKRVRAFEYEYDCHSPTEERWFAMRATPFESEGPTRVVVSHKNITSQRLMERLAQEQGGLREAVAGMEQVLGVVGHELRTPLAAMRAISEFLLLEGGSQSDQAQKFLADISSEVDRMTNTVNNLIETALLNSGRIRWNWSEFDIRSAINEALASLKPLIEIPDLKITRQIDDSLGWMKGDVSAVERLLINLLSNAIKHTQRGRIDVAGRRFGDSNGDWIEISVADTGNGIAPNVLARLGKAFALNSGVVGKNHISGAGLGLAICKGIAAAHGGDVRIDSILNCGTTVKVRLRTDLIKAATGDTASSEPETESVE